MRTIVVMSCKQSDDLTQNDDDINRTKSIVYRRLECNRLCSLQARLLAAGLRYSGIDVRVIDNSKLSR